jgi:hypothetical protein
VTLKLALQHLEIVWSKESRGTHDGHRAAERNAVPRSFPFAPPGEAEQGWFQQVTLDSGDRFAPRVRWTRMEEMDAHYLPLRWRQDGDFHWIGRRNLFLQKPKRPNLDQWFAKLPIGKRLVLRVNTAIDWENVREYREHHLIIGWSKAAMLDLPLFREIDERELLY